MAGGIKLFRILGIQISLDYTWFIVFVLFAWSLAYGYFPFHSPGLGAGMYLLMGTISSLLLFVCVLIHELSHSYTANRLGLSIQEITLFIFGGVANLTKEPDDAIVELKIALAGPLASGALAIGFWLIRALIDAELYPVPYAIAGFLVTINIVLLVFNMIPGFPLDGGRVLRAIWWYSTGDINRATRVASQIGKGFAIFLIVTGFLQILVGNFTGGLWSVLIGVFLQQAAEGSYRQLIIKRTLEGIRVRDVMTKNVVTIDGSLSLSRAVEDYFFNYHFVSFPVVDNGRVVGMLSLNNVRSIERDRWQSTLVRDVMEGLTTENVLSPEDTVIDALTRMSSMGVGRFPVVEGGRLVGILSRRDIMKVMEFRTELQGWA